MPHVTPELEDVAHELYGLTPQEFTAARNARAKEVTGEKELSAGIRRLQRPAASAWAVNTLVRHLGAEIEQLLSLGAALRDAQRDLDRGALADLTRRRRQLLAALTAEATALTEDLGHRIAPSAADEVEQTLQAALADPDAAIAVQSGMLVRSLASVGFEPVDLDGAVAVGATGTRSAPQARKVDGGGPNRRAQSGDNARKQKEEREQKTGRDEKREQDRGAARETASDAEREVAEADAALRLLDERAGELERRRDNLAVELDDLKQQVDEVETDIAALDRETRTLDRDRDKAERAAVQARRAHARARERMERMG